MREGVASVVGKFMNLIKTLARRTESHVTIAAFVIISQRFARKSGRKLHGRSNKLAKRYLATLVILCIRFPSRQNLPKTKSPSRANETQTIQEQDFGCNEY